MTNRPTPILVSEKSAARLMDMKPSEFRGLVDAGVLPGSTDFGGLDRWRYADLDAVATGAAMEEDFEV